MKVLYVFIKIFSSLILIIVGLILFLYTSSDVIEFDLPRKFKGSEFYNPYHDWDPWNTFKANFHAHSFCWSGLSNGKNSPFEIEQEYLNKDYKVAGVSNYHNILNQSLKKIINIPIYEHGYNIFKCHQLVIGSNNVNFFDFPLLQNLSQKQMILDNLHAKNTLVTIAHPNFGRGYKIDDFKYLENYEFIEVFSNYAKAIEFWDMALQNGHKVWCMANDDTHDIIKQPIGKFYNILSGKNLNEKLIKKTLLSGCFVSVKSPNSNMDFELESIYVKNNSVFYDFNGSIDKIEIIADGKIWKTTNTKIGNFDIPENISYVRFQVYHNENILLTNPIFRVNKNRIDFIHHKTNVTLSIIFKILYFLAFLAIILFSFYLKLSSKKIN